MPLALTASPRASAQCPSNASSCAVCHEGGERPPGQDGTPWHSAHAYADVCVGCHGGDREAMDLSAHQGMDSPLAAEASPANGALFRRAPRAPSVDDGCPTPSGPRPMGLRGCVGK